MQEVFALNSQIIYTHLHSIALIITGLSSAQLVAQTSKNPVTIAHELKDIENADIFRLKLQELKKNLKQHWDLTCLSIFERQLKNPTIKIISQEDRLKNLKLEHDQRQLLLLRNSILEKMITQIELLQSRYHRLRRFILNIFQIKMYGPDYAKLCELIELVELVNNKLLMGES